MSNLKKFTDAYIEAMFFSDTGEEDQPPSDADLSTEGRLDIEADCRSFWRRYGCYILTDVCAVAFRDSVEQAGHDFHFTRNGHGVGFWEKEWPECYRDMLDRGAKSYGEVDLMLDDNGEAFIC